MDGIRFTPNPKLLHFVRFVGYNYIADKLKLITYSLLYSLPVHITLIGSLFRRSNPIGFWLVCISTGGGVDRFTPPPSVC